MTFGEHLEELRGALIKALLWLFAGFAIGLFFGDRVVDFIKLPLVSELKNYYTQQSAIDYYHILDNEGRGEDQDEIPPRKANDTQVADLSEQLLEFGWTFKEFYVERKILRKAVAEEAPAEAAETLPDKEPDKEPDAEKPDTKPGDEGADEAATAPTRLLKKADFVAFPLWSEMSRDERIDPSAFNVSEAFMFYLKGSLLAGFILASPMIFRELWLFVAAGLYPNEKRYVHVFLPFSVALFLGGSLFCFFIVFPFILKFLFSFNQSLGIAIEPRISEWLSFALILPIGFGLSFQLPLVMLFLQRIGVFTIEIYLAKWRIAVLVIAVISMLLTPADPMSMIAMLIPLTVLYFGGILLCKYMPESKGILDE